MYMCNIHIITTESSFWLFPIVLLSLESSQWSFLKFPLTILAKAVEQNLVWTTHSFKLNTLTQFILWKRETRGRTIQARQTADFPAGLSPTFLPVFSSCLWPDKISLQGKKHSSQYVHVGFLFADSSAGSFCCCIYNHAEWWVDLCETA